MFYRTFALALKLFVALIVCTTGVPHAQAQWSESYSAPYSNVVYIQNDPGGAIDHYLARYAQYRQSGTRVVITGQCMSACTLVLSLPRSQVCAKPGAVFGFHAARFATGTLAPEGTRILMKEYPANVRAWISARGGLKRDFI